MRSILSCIMGLFCLSMAACTTTQKCDFPEYKLQEQMIGVVYTSTQKTDIFVDFYHQVKPDVPLAKYPGTYPDNVEIFYPFRLDSNRPMLMVLIAKECVVGVTPITLHDLEKIINQPSEKVVLK